MWWRVLGVAVVLLALGVAGGYAVGERTDPEPPDAGVPSPAPAVSPAVPTPVVYDVRPDPTAAPLEPGIASVTSELRLTKKSAGISVLTPEGWLSNRLPDSDTWIFAPEINIKNTYTLRAELKIGQRLAATVFKAARLAALQSAEEEGNLQDLQITAQTPTSLEATYIDGGYLRVTMEQWVADANGTAYADIAVTGRTADTEGLRDLLARTAESVTYLDPLPTEEKQDEAQSP